ncbi:MAG: phosphoribosylformylglycinamidine synthase subunit PurQ [Devosiaceae bacterium]|nr:phosphoribosylformylglycinamidine synthase subunit PurQ [Devosiaceae bacterium MH13]
MALAVIQFPGSNRDSDMVEALAHVTGTKPHLVWHAETSLPAGIEAVVLPGGFSYGDYLRCGAIAARAPVMTEVAKRAQQGLPVIGVCNGFQILIEAGLLPGALMRNANLRFVCKTVDLEVQSNRSRFLEGFDVGTRWACPVAHGDGNYVCSADMLARLQDTDSIALTYASGSNPNGSVANIAGITNEAGNVLGMMPHPENISLPHQPTQVGARIFEGLLHAAA